MFNTELLFAILPSLRGAFDDARATRAEDLIAWLRREARRAAGTAGDI
jgi:hypothetical protein